MSNGNPPRIGLLAQELHDEFPRGITRVARRIAEELAQRGDLELYCLTARLPGQRTLTYRAESLTGWLATHPIARPLSRRAVLGRRMYCALRDALPTTLFQRIAPLFAAGAASLRTLRTPTAQVQPATPADTLTLNDLDAVLLCNYANSHVPLVTLPVETQRARLIAWCHDLFPLSHPEMAVYSSYEDFYGLASLCALRADLIVADSRYSEKEMHGFFPLTRDKTTLLYIGHDMQQFRRAAGHPLPATLQLPGMQTGVPFFLFVGGLEPRKNFTGMLQACEILASRANEQPFQLLVIGNQAKREACSELLHRVRARMPVIMPGYQPDSVITALMANAVAFLFPSFTEGFGIPMLEAMSAGTLVVAANTGALPEIGGPHPFYCDPSAAESIAAAMESCLRLPAAERAIRTANAQAYASSFTWKRTSDNLVALLHGALAKPKPSVPQVESLVR